MLNAIVLSTVSKVLKGFHVGSRHMHKMEIKLKFIDRLWLIEAQVTIVS